MGKKLNQSIIIAEPIKDINDIKRVKEWLKNYNIMYYTIFVVGINSGLRISDILHLTIKEVENADFVTIIERKTGKRKQFPLTDESKKAIAEYLPIRKNKFVLEGYEDFLFVGKQGKRLDRSNVSRIFKRVEKNLGLDLHFSTHTMRKTFGYHLYKQTKDLALVQKILNHSSQSVTQRYIGIEQDEINYAYKHLKYKNPKAAKEPKIIDTKIIDRLNSLDNKINWLMEKIKKITKPEPQPENKNNKTVEFLLNYIRQGGKRYRDFAEMALRGC